MSYSSQQCSQSKILNLAIQLPRYLRREQAERKRFQRFYEDVWKPKRTDVITQLHLGVQILRSEKKTSNKLQIVAKSASIVGKAATMGGLACPLLAVGGFITTLAADGMSMLLSIDDADTTSKWIAKVSVAFKEDSENTKKLNSILSQFKLALSDLKGYITELHRATMSGVFDHDIADVPLRMFLKEIRGVTNLDVNGTIIFLNALAKFVGVTVSSTISSIVFSYSYLKEYNPAALNAMGSATRIFATGVLGKGAKMGKCVTGLNLIFIGMDIADIVEMGTELDSGNVTTNTAEKLKEIEEKLSKELTLISRGVAKLN